MWCNTWRNEGCSISSDIIDFPDIGSTSFLLWSTIFPHPLVISEFSHPFKHQVLPLSLWYLELYQQSSPSLLKATRPHPLWHRTLPYHLGVTTHSSFAYFFVSSLVASHVNLILGLQPGMGSEKIEYVWHHKRMSLFGKVHDFIRKCLHNRDLKMNH